MGPSSTEDKRIGKQVDSKSIALHGVAGSSPVSSAGKKIGRMCTFACLPFFVVERESLARGSCAELVSIEVSHCLPSVANSGKWSLGFAIIDWLRCFYRWPGDQVF